jgi:diguanylate cyclase (GGDEF)-like protein/PAS domain S-box-containing protein
MMETNPVSILVVDDDDLTRRILCEALQVGGYEPTAAVDGRQALELNSKGFYELVLLDLKMPGMSGIEVLKTLRRQYSGDELPVIVISAMEESQGISSALKWGANDYIEKPVQSSVLAARIDKLLDSKIKTKAYRDLKENLESLVEQRTEELNLSNLALHRDREQYEYLLSHSPAITYISSADFTCRFISNNIGSILGYPASAVLGKDFWEASIHPEDQNDRLLGMNRNLKLNGGGDAEYRFLHRDGTYRWIQDRYRVVTKNDRVEEIVGSMIDITESKTLEAEAAYKASYDELTGLINRSTFENQVGDISDGKDNTKHVLCFLDVDEIKIINNVHGHVGVEELLRQLGKKLVDTLSKRDTVGYLGLDKFGMLLRGCSLEQSAKVLERITDALKEYRFKWDGKSHVITMSIGVIEIDRRLVDAREAINAANWACDIAKEAGGDRIQVYTENTELVKDRRQEMQWVEKVNRALEEDRFLLFYQPIVPIDKNNKEKHFELLIRMKDEAGKIVPPGFFLPAVERYRLSSKIDRWVIRTTFSWLDVYREYLEMDYRWGINLSGQSLDDMDLLQFVFDQLESNQIPPEKIYFEITETAAIANLVNATNFIAALRTKGCQFALDDFGSGLSSFSYLKNLAVDYLKIDGIFVKDMATDEIDVAMVKAISNVGQAMGMRTIAEFVENAEILEILGQIGVDYAQGYGICKPQPLHEFKAD